MELWTQLTPNPRAAEQTAAEAEAAGWSGLNVGDSQNISGDVYVAMTLAVSATTSLRVSTGVTNPVTRHPAVTATAAASVSAISDGRAEIGIGRGDSSLAHIGLAPCGVAHFDKYLEVLQRYLSGNGVYLEEAQQFACGQLPPPVETLRLAAAPQTSQLRWLANDPIEKVPVWVTASGPKVIDLAAKRADRVTLVLGADPARLKWGIDRVRALAPAAPIGAYIDVLVDEDIDRALKRGAGRIATHARFSAMHGQVGAPASQEDRAVMQKVAATYDMTSHAGGTAPQGRAITRDFAESFAVIGPASKCVERIQELAELGVDRFHVWGTILGEGERDPIEREVLGRLVD